MLIGKTVKLVFKECAIKNTHKIEHEENVSDSTLYLCTGEAYLVFLTGKHMTSKDLS